MPSKIGIIGLGSIGATIAHAYDKLGYIVLGNDVRAEPYHKLNVTPTRTDEIAEAADVVFIVVPTRTTENGCDTSIVEDVVSDMTADASIVIRSTVEPGTTRRLSKEYGLPLVHMPEMLRDKGDIDEFYNQDRFVVAGPEAEREPVVEMHRAAPFTADIYEYDSTVTAELGKYAHNAMWATKVSFANQMRMLADRFAVDESDVMDVVTADERVHPSHLDPTLGPYQGRCVPKDTQALIKAGVKQNVAVPLLEAAETINEYTKWQMGEDTPSGDMATHKD